MVQYLDLFVSLLGILYLWWEYRAHWMVWVAGIIMPAIDIYLYYEVGLYGDMAISVYYLLAAFYGLVLWTLPVVGKRVTTSSGKQVRAITSMPRDVAVRLAFVFFLIW